MTAREYAKECGVEIIGNLARKVHVQTEWDWDKCEDVEKRTVYWEDEAGNEFYKDKNGGWCLVEADGMTVH